MPEYTLSQINPPLREEFIRSGALHAAWRAHSYEMAVSSLKDAMEDKSAGLEPAKLLARQQFLALAILFVEQARDKQLERALIQLKLWEAFRKGELDEGTVLPE